MVPYACRELRKEAIVGAMPLTHREVTRLGRHLAERTHAVISRRDLNGRGIDRHAVRVQVRNERWIPLGPNALRVLDAPWDDALSPIVVATLNVSERAWVDGASALLLAGLSGWRADEIDISLPVGTNARTQHPVRVHRLASLPRLSLLPVPHAHPGVAALRAAAWSDTDRQAAALLSMPVQQRLALPEQMLAALDDLPSLPRRRLVRNLLMDITGGSESTGELDFLAECRRRGLPLPDRQVKREGARGSMYLDAFWDWAKLCVEIDGAHHFVGDMPVKDALRQNELALCDLTTIRIPRTALRTGPDPFFAQIERHLTAARCDAQRNS